MHMVLFLIVAGAVLELIGIGLALREIHKRRSEVEAHETRPMSGHGVGFMSASGSLAVGSAPPVEPPPLEQRVEALERALPALQSELQASERRATESARQVAETMTQAVRNHLAADLDGVRTLLLDVTRPTAAVWWSIGFLVVGLALQTIANVVQMMTPSAAPGG